MTLPFTGSAARIARLIGPAATARLLAWRGGREINIPATAKPGTQLLELLGAVDAQKLIDEFGPGRITLPTGPVRGTGGRKREAMAMLRDGAALGQVAAACDLHIRTVVNYKAELEAADGRQLDLFDTTSTPD
jgi:hypothetical protein